MQTNLFSNSSNILAHTSFYIEGTWTTDSEVLLIEVYAFYIHLYAHLYIHNEECGNYCTFLSYKQVAFTTIGIVQTVCYSNYT